MSITELKGYEEFLRDLKARICSAQVRAALAVNSELVLLYWQIGRDILTRQEKEGWGAKVVERLATDLRREFPEMKGLSRANLIYMRAFAEAWPDEKFVQQVVGQIPWGHNLMLLSKVKSRDEREWYIRKAIAHGWSRNVMVHQIESGLIRRQGKAITNFAASLPVPQSDLANETLKDPYIFDFGLILCKDKNRLVAEYALKDIAKPVGMLEYRLVEAIPEELKTSLPTIEQLEAELSGEEQAN